MAEARPLPISPAIVSDGLSRNWRDGGIDKGKDELHTVHARTGARHDGHVAREVECPGGCHDGGSLSPGRIGFEAVLSDEALLAVSRAIFRLYL